MNKLGKFEILGKIGQGAMGVVYKARDPFIDRIVALKTLTIGFSEDPHHLKRFYSEARSAGNLRHPNIVTIYELGHEGDTPFIAMQFLNGESLDKIIDRMPNLPLSQRLGIVVHVCRALDYAHRQNPPVIHRDVKPGNVMVAPDGSVFVVDFGIARLGDSTVSQSKGLLIGTLGYMSPQLFRGTTADARSDVWATGVMFYELLAYRRPFKGENAAALMSNIILEDHRSIQEAAPGTPDDVRVILDRMLAKDADLRYQTMDELLAALEPVWQRYLQSDISVMLENSKRLYQDGDLMAAKSEIVQILAWDPTNTQAKGIADRISSDIRRQQLGEHLSSLIENSRKLFDQGHHEEAKSQAEAALKLDSSFVPAQEMLSEIREVLDRTREIDVAIQTSREKMGEGALTDAETQLDKVLAIDPGNVVAQDQRKRLQQERATRERMKHREGLLKNARALFAKSEFDKCVESLLTARAQFPADHEILQQLDLARREQQRTKERQDLLKQRMREVERMIDRQSLTEAIDLARQTIATVGPDLRLSDILATAERELEFREQKKREQEQRLRSARAMLDEGRFDEASSTAKEALEIHLFAETDPRIASLLAEIYTRKKSLSGMGSSEIGTHPSSDFFPAGTKSDSWKSDSGKDYVYIRGNQPQKASPVAGLGTPTSNADPSGIAAHGIGFSPSPSASGDGSPGATSSDAGQRTVIGLPPPGSTPASGWQDRERLFVTSVEKKLASYIGPIAGIIVSRTAAKASDPMDLITLLAATLQVEADRKAFLSLKNELLRNLTVPLVISPSVSPEVPSGASTASQTSAPTSDVPIVPLAPERTRRAGELLARYLGPVSKILVERAALRASNEKALYGMLAEHLQNAAERAQFLRDAGYLQS
jgi:serine/threonine protein kinase